MGSSHGDIGGQESELGIHGCGVDVLSSLEAVLVQDQARRGGDQAAQIDPFWFRSVLIVVFEDGEDLVGATHFDGTGEVEVSE